MEVVGHETEGVDLPAGPGAALSKRFEKGFPVVIILEDGLAAVAAAHDMINRALILNAQLACHAERVGPASRLSIVRTDPFMVQSPKTLRCHSGEKYAVKKVRNNEDSTG